MRKFQIVLILILSLFIIFTGNVYAVATNQVTMTSNKTEVKPKETFVVTVSASSNGTVDGLSSKMEFNENILEVVSTQLIDDNRWSNLDNFPNLIAMWKTQTSDVSSADIFRITFKVKEGVVQQDTNIKLTNIILSTAPDGQNSVRDVEKIIHIKLSEDNNGGSQGSTADNNGSNQGGTANNNGGNQGSTADNNGGSQGGTTDNNGGNQVGIGSNKGSNQGDANNNKSIVGGNVSKSTDSTTSNTKLPFAGELLNKIILAFTIVFAVFGAYRYILYRKYRNI